MATIETIHKCFTDYFNAMQFVSKAIAKEDSRPILNFIKVENTEIKTYAYAADGYRLHIADITDCPPIPEGLYSIVKSNKKELILQKEDYEGNYPDIWQLIPDAPCVKEFTEGIGFDCFYAHVVRALSDGTGINHKYLKDIDPDNHEWSMWYNEGPNPIGFKNNTLCAVIMPMFIQTESHYDYHIPVKHYDKYPRFPSSYNPDIDLDTDMEDEPIIDDSTPEDVNEFIRDNQEVNNAIEEITPETITVCVG